MIKKKNENLTRFELATLGKYDISLYPADLAIETSQSFWLKAIRVLTSSITNMIEAKVLTCWLKRSSRYYLDKLRNSLKSKIGDKIKLIADTNLIRTGYFQRAEYWQVNVGHDEAHQEDRNNDEPILRTEIVDFRRCSQNRHAADVRSDK